MSLFAPPNYPGQMHDPSGLTKQPKKSRDQKPAAQVAFHPLEVVSPTDGPRTQTTSPIVTGTSVLAIRYSDGIAIAADTLASYGSLARYRDVRRIARVGSYTLIGASGEYSDFQYLSDELDAMMTSEYTLDDGATLYPKEIYNYLTRVMYARRSKMNPLWNQLVVAGFRDGKPFLGMVDLYGTSYEDDTVATGYGAHIARPLLRTALDRTPPAQLTEEAAKKILEDSLRVMFYRDARASNRIQMATVSQRGISVSEPYDLATDWEFGRHIQGH